MQHYHLYTDDDLLALLKTGDGQAFNEVYNRYWKILFSITSSRLRNIHTAEDIIHDVFVGLWKNRKNSDIRSLQHYLASSTRYLIFKVIRKNAYVHQYAAPGEDITFEPENSLHNKYLLEYISREVDSLPEKCRMIFKYSREKGMTNKEIALEMNITSKTVENQINKALHRLRFSMKKMLMVLF